MLGVKGEAPRTLIVELVASRCFCQNVVRGGGRHGAAGITCQEAVMAGRVARVTA